MEFTLGNKLMNSDLVSGELVLDHSELWHVGPQGGRELGVLFHMLVLHQKHNINAHTHACMHTITGFNNIVITLTYITQTDRDTQTDI